MGTFRAGQWVILLLFYFVVYFLAVYAVLGMKSVLYLSDVNANYTDPGFQTLVADYVNFGGKCTNNPSPTAKNYVNGGIYCEDLDTTQGTCNTIAGCNWTNNTAWFGIVTTGEVLCKGFVNMTIYNLSESVILNTEFCKDIKNQTMCEIFTCSWANSSELPSQSFSYTTSIKTVSTFSESIKLMLGFRTDLGLKSYAWLWALFFTYLPSLMLMYSLYMSVRGG